MYHSHLLINIGDKPDRPDWNITRKWLRNLYRVHQRLCMAFPSRAPATTADRLAAYCAPYGGGGAHDRDLPGEEDPGVPPCDAPVHRERSDEAGFLFRIDHPVYDVVNGRATWSGHPRRRPVIVVQSGGDQPPDWDLAFGLNESAVDDYGRPIGNAAHLLAGPPQCRKVSFALEGGTLRLSREDRPDGGFTVRRGDRVRFRLRANPVCRRDGKRRRPWITPEEFSGDGERRERAFIEAHEDWLIRRLADAAEDVECFSRDAAGERVETLVTGWAWGWRTRHEPQANQKMQFWSVLFEGTFRVKDPATLKMHLESGIGPAKAFGFGLLSIAPVR
ncbi:MAG: type I-E CRISPR-associated protein Cas6/Cse3/CasE [Phycisphaerales bacterium]|nr:type I-E CRISPR-associated protein Cas6/Cse3/CasE [Phycisphaerales bacterium]